MRDRKSICGDGTINDTCCLHADCYRDISWRRARQLLYSNYTASTVSATTAVNNDYGAFQIFNLPYNKDMFMVAADKSKPCIYWVANR